MDVKLMLPITKHALENNFLLSYQLGRILSAIEEYGIDAEVENLEPVYKALDTLLDISSISTYRFVERVHFTRKNGFDHAWGWAIHAQEGFALLGFVDLVEFLDRVLKRAKELADDQSIMVVNPNNEHDYPYAEEWLYEEVDRFELEFRALREVALKGDIVTKVITLIEIDIVDIETYVNFWVSKITATEAFKEKMHARPEYKTISRETGLQNWHQNLLTKLGMTFRLDIWEYHGPEPFKVVATDGGLVRFYYGKEVPIRIHSFDGNRVVLDDTNAFEQRKTKNDRRSNALDEFGQANTEFKQKVERLSRWLPFAHVYVRALMALKTWHIGRIAGNMGVKDEYLGRFGLPPFLCIVMILVFLDRGNFVFIEAAFKGYTNSWTLVLAGLFVLMLIHGLVVTVGYGTMFIGLIYGSIERLRGTGPLVEGTYKIDDLVGHENFITRLKRRN